MRAMVLAMQKSGHLGTCGGGCKCAGGDKETVTPTLGAIISEMEETVKGITRLVDTLPEPARPVQQYAVPTPADAALADADPDNKSPNGDPHGDAKIMRRRRATEVERLIKENRKRAKAKASGSSEARARWDAEYQELSAELAAIREAERNEREQYKQF